MNRIEKAANEGEGTVRVEASNTTIVPPVDNQWGPGLTSTVEHCIDLGDMRVEIRRYEWTTDAVQEISSDWYCFTRMLGNSDTSPAFWKLPGATRFISFGECWLTPPNTRMEVWHEPAVLRGLVLRVEPTTFCNITALEPGWYDEKLVELVNKEGLAPVITLADIADEMTSPGYASKEMVAALAKLFLVRFARMIISGRQVTATGGLGDWQMKRIREMVERSPANTLSVDRLAESCGISSRHLMRAFKAVTGLTVHSYIDQVRLERTKILLKETMLSLHNIAIEVGFGNASYLSTVFSRKFGTSPSRYRQLSKAAESVLSQTQNYERTV